MEELGFDFIIVEPTGDESSIDNDPRVRAQRNAESKARSVSKLYADSIVIGADTIVYLDGVFLGKPSDPDDAMNMLRMLSGRTHQVYTGITVVNTSTAPSTRVCETHVRFKNLSMKQISDYVASGEPLDKAGAYGIQGRGGDFVAEIDGSYSNVVGLPVELLKEMLE